MEKKILAAFKERYGYDASHLPHRLSILGTHLVIDFYDVYNVYIDETGNIVGDSRYVDRVFAIARLYDAHSKLKEDYDKLEQENTKLRQQIEELQLRPPTSGGDLYREAKERFNSFCANQSNVSE